MTDGENDILRIMTDTIRQLAEGQRYLIGAGQDMRTALVETRRAVALLAEEMSKLVVTLQGGEVEVE